MNSLRLPNFGSLLDLDILKLRGVTVENSDLADLDARIVVVKSGQVSDLSFVLGMPDIEVLDLTNNRITDVSLLLNAPGIDRGDLIVLDGNPLDPLTAFPVIQALRARRVDVSAKHIGEDNRSL